MHLLLSTWLLQMPVPVGGVATPDPPAMTTTGVQEWTLGEVLRVKRYSFLRWQPALDIRSRWHLLLQPIFIVEMEPMRWKWLVLSLASAPALESGMPGVASARLQLRMPGTAARLGLEQGFVGGFSSSAVRGQVGSLPRMRGGARVVFSMPF